MKTDTNVTAPDDTSGHDRYFPLSPVKLGLMSICTFGVYEIYWAYKNWKYVKRRDSSKIMPFWRAIFAPLWYYSLLRDLHQKGQAPDFGRALVCALLVIAYFAALSSWKLPDPYAVVSFLSFLLLIPAARAINALNEGNHALAMNSRVKPLNIVAYLIGAPLVLFTSLSSFNVIPSAEVVPGSRMWEKELEFLRSYDLLGPGETIDYYYSTAMLSFEDDGNYFTDRRVVSYWIDQEDGEFYAAEARYDEIADISTKFSSTILDDTVVTITKTDEAQFMLWISIEAKKDKIFVKALMDRWKQR